MSEAITEPDVWGPPGLVASREFDLSSAWFTDLCLWLGSRVGALRPFGWPMVLIPEVVDRRFRLAEKALAVYQRVTWHDDVPRTPFTVEAGVAWVSTLGDSVEVGSTSRAGELAESLTVTRARGAAESWGERRLPAAPEPGSLTRRRSLVIDEHQVRTFTRLAGTRYPIHDDILYAQRAGYPNVVVQGHVLLIILMYLRAAGRSGQVEMWFRRAVPAGSALELCEGEDGVWAYRLVANREVVALIRMSAGEAP